MLTPQQWIELVATLEAEPIGDNRADARAALQIAAIRHAMIGDEMEDPNDWLPKFDRHEVEEDSDEDAPTYLSYLRQQVEVAKLR